MWTAGHARAQVRADRPPPGAWVVVTDEHHAACLPQALPTAPMALRVADGVGTVVIDVAGQPCHEAIDRLMAYGVTDVTIDGQLHALVDLGPHCRRAPADARWAVSLADVLRAEQALWDRVTAVLDADARRSTDVKLAAAVAATCAADAARIPGAPGLDHSVATRLRHWRFTHDGWTGTLPDLGRTWCPRVEAAAERIARRAAALARLSEPQRALYTQAPDRWHLPGRRGVADAPALVGARVWVRIDDTTLDDLIEQRCPLDAPAVTRTTLLRFDRRGAVTATEVTTTCTPAPAIVVRPR